jgi:hypothetical protein
MWPISAGSHVVVQSPMMICEAVAEGWCPGLMDNKTQPIVGCELQSGFPRLSDRSPLRAVWHSSEFVLRIFGNMSCYMLVQRWVQGRRKVSQKGARSTPDINEVDNLVTKVGFRKPVEIPLSVRQQASPYSGQFILFRDFALAVLAGALKTVTLAMDLWLVAWGV